MVGQPSKVHDSLYGMRGFYYSLGICFLCACSSAASAPDALEVRRDGFSPIEHVTLDAAWEGGADKSSATSDAALDEADVRDTALTVRDTAQDVALRDAAVLDTMSLDATLVRDSGREVFAITTWPGDSTVQGASAPNSFGKNLSGLVYQPATSTAAAILWAVQNDPSKIFRLNWNGTAFAPVAIPGWEKGKLLTYPSGKGRPDSEGITRTEWEKDELYVVAERNNEEGEKSRLSILRYDLGGSATTILATHEWDLTGDLPATAPNEGLEGIAWVPDTYLVDRGFWDEGAQVAYNPQSYPNHGAGVFFVGMEATGKIFGFVLDHTASTFRRVATFASGQVGVMDLTFDRDHGTLWALCDGACKGRMALLDVESNVGLSTRGRFILKTTVPAPGGISGLNNEGFSLAPEAECLARRKAFYWADDDETDGVAIRRGSLDCGRLY